MSWLITSAFNQLLQFGTLTLVINDSDEELIDFIQKNYGEKTNLMIIQKSKDSNVSELLQDFTAPVLTEGGEASQQLSVRYMSTIVKNLKVYADADSSSVKVFLASKPKQENTFIASSSSELIQENPKLSVLNSDSYICRVDFKNYRELEKLAILFDHPENFLIEELIENCQNSSQVAFLTLSQDESINLATTEGLAQIRKSFFESRSYNSLDFDFTTKRIKKFSLNSEKLNSEYLWYMSLPRKFASYIPAFIELVGDNNDVLQMEFIQLNTLSQYYSYKTLPLIMWQEMLDELFSLNKDFRFEALENSHNARIMAQEIYLDKTFQRMADLSQSDSIISDLMEMESIVVNGTTLPGFKILLPAILISLKTLTENATTGIIHGDFCFSNIFYDLERSTIKLIDPRGTFGSSENTIFGDPRYDIAKLRHSFCGKYDWILEGLFEVTRSGEYSFNLRYFRHNDFDDEIVFDQLCLQYGYDPFEIRFIEAYLFLTMIPLHSDSLSRQIVFFLTAMSKFHSVLIECNRFD